MAIAAVLVTGSARAWLFPIKTDEWITRPDAVSAPPMLHHTPRAVVRTTASSSAKCRMSQGGGSVGQRCTTGPMSGYEAETRSECAHCEALAALERDFPVAHAAELRRFLKKVYVHMHRCAHTHTDTRRHHVQCMNACMSHMRMRSVIPSILSLSAFSAACMHTCMHACIHTYVCKQTHMISSILTLSGSSSVVTVTFPDLAGITTGAICEEKWPCSIAAMVRR